MPKPTIKRSFRERSLASMAAKGEVQRLLAPAPKIPATACMYVDELVGPDTVNTLPPSTIEACAVTAIRDRVETGVEAEHLIASLKDPDININLDEDGNNSF